MTTTLFQGAVDEGGHYAKGDSIVTRMGAFALLASLLLAGAASGCTASEGGAGSGPAAVTPATGDEAISSDGSVGGGSMEAACNAGAVQSAIGEIATPARVESLRRQSGAATVRVLPPGAVTTRDFRTDRLNIDVDAGNRIRALRCG